MKNLLETQNIIEGSKTFTFDYSEESGRYTILEVTSYNTGERVRLDLSKLTADMLDELQVSDDCDEYRHHIVISEQIDLYDEQGNFCGTDELDCPVSESTETRPNYASFQDYLRHLYPGKRWEFYDGDDWNDNPYTDYCQYFCTIDREKDHILLAAYNIVRKDQHIEERKEQ